MRPDSPRWREVSDSEFAHERAGLAVIRDLLPDRAPYRAYSNFEFRDSQGRWHEVDLLLIGEKQLHLVELKHYQGRIGGSGYRWVRGAGRTEDSPVLLTRRKAQRLASVIGDGLRDAGWTGRTPWLQQSVFLHADSCRVDLPYADRTDLFGLPGRENHSGLPSIEARLLEPAHGQDPLLAADDLLPALFDKIGFVVRREREIGSWRLTGTAIGDGDGWQDWPAEHRSDPTDTARVRFYVNAPGSSTAAIEGRAEMVRREFRITKRLTHDGLLVPIDLVDHELGTGLVFRTGKDDQRLDLWLAEHEQSLGLAERLGLVRQLVEAVAYAHENHVVHRDLHPGAIAVSGTPGTASQVRARVGDWQKAGRDEASDTTGVTRLLGALSRRDHREDDPALGYRAPEVRFDSKADRVRLDVFGLGALAYLVLSGQPPASSALELRERVRAGVGLDLSVAVPGVPTAVRELVRACTHPTVSSRPASLAAVGELLTAAERAVRRADVDVDPLDAGPDDVLADRYRVLRRLGKGSTAVGLLVEDFNAQQRVLKIGLDDQAAARLRDEAEILRALAPLKSARLVNLAEPEPVTIGTRTALVLEPAGEETLADVLRARRRMSIDLLERFGTDLCEALVTLDAAGIDHRDIKPANLGVRAQRSDRAKHLVLFDFSLARAGADAVQAGTPPYLDPFLGEGRRQTWDSAAERYAAAVTLYEMATGTLPAYGDGASHPAAIADEVSLNEADFDPSLAESLIRFFRRALAREARNRHDTAESFRSAWRSVFSDATTVLDNGEQSADSARPETPLALSGLSPRALSALEPLGLRTVADLVAVDPSALSRLSGVAATTRDDIRNRAKQWRLRYGATTPANVAPAVDEPKGPDLVDPLVQATDDPFADAVSTAALLAARAVRGAAPARTTTVRAILGLYVDKGPEPFATLPEVALAVRGAAANADVTEVSAQLNKVHETLTIDEAGTALLHAVAERATEALQTLGGVAHAIDVVDLLSTNTSQARRAAAGLIRLTLDHGTDRLGVCLVARRQPSLAGGSRMLLAKDTRLLDAAPVLARAAEQLVTDHRREGPPLVPASRAVAEVGRCWPAEVSRPADVTLVACVARLSDDVAASSQGELYGRDLSASDAVAVCLASLSRDATPTRDDVRTLVQSRFDRLDIPEADRLDRLVEQAGLGLHWDGNAYRNPTIHASTTGLARRPLTVHVSADPVERSADDEPFLHSRSTASFLAVMAEPLRLDETADALEQRYAAARVDTVQLLLDALRSAAEAKGVPWSAVTAADAAEPGTTAARGLAALVAESVPQVVARVDELVTAEPAGHAPVLVTGAGVLARYGHGNVVARWADITARRNQAIWVLVPEIDGTATLDGHPIGLNHANQLVRASQSLIAVSP